MKKNSRLEFTFERKENEKLNARMRFQLTGYLKIEVI